MAGKLFPNPQHAALRRQIEERLARNDRAVYLRAARGLSSWSVLDRLPEISCPVLVLASDRDYTPVKIKQAYAAQIADRRSRMRRWKC